MFFCFTKDYKFKMKYQLKKILTTTIKIAKSIKLKVSTKWKETKENVLINIWEIGAHEKSQCEWMFKHR